MTTARPRTQQTPRQELPPTDGPKPPGPPENWTSGRTTQRPTSSHENGRSSPGCRSSFRSANSKAVDATLVAAATWIEQRVWNMHHGTRRFQSPAPRSQVARDRSETHHLTTVWRFVKNLSENAWTMLRVFGTSVGCLQWREGPRTVPVSWNSCIRFEPAELPRGCLIVTISNDAKRLKLC